MLVRIITRIIHNTCFKFFSYPISGSNILKDGVEHTHGLCSCTHLHILMISSDPHRFTFEPLWRLGLIASLSHWAGWKSTYGVSTSNIDIWLLSMLKSLTLTVLIHMAPMIVNRGDDGSSTIHEKVRSSVGHSR